GAVQDLDRGAIVGERTFGKGLVQVIKQLPFQTSLKITTARYYTPSGRSIQAIDYGNHDGTFSTIPDSLRKEFETRAGRLVYDGGGIEPDVNVSPGDLSELEEALDRRAAFFFFANHFASTRDTIAPDFQVDAEIMAEFEAWLQDQEFQYRIDAERRLDELAEGLDAIEYEQALDKLSDLREALVAEKQEDLERHRDRIAERLRAEILKRYYGDSAQIEASLAHDPQFKVAVELLRDRSAYEELLAIGPDAE
ncbi:MAG TPA: S41 family peptidase, partial [Rhodothermales bacterium]